MKVLQPVNKNLEIIPDELPLKKIMIDTSNGGIAIDKATAEYIYTRPGAVGSKPSRNFCQSSKVL
jgi:hypothetical protein